MTKHEGGPNDAGELVERAGVGSVTDRAILTFVIQVSFVVGYFVLRH